MRASTQASTTSVVMGRSPGQQFFIGDYGPILDFNYHKDPLSAQLVFESGIPIVLTPFELSREALIEPSHLSQINGHGTASSTYLFNKAQAWLGFWHGAFPHENGFHPWDSAAVAYLHNPDLLQCEKRGFAFEMVTELASEAGTGKVEKQRPWLVMSAAFSGPKHTYCHGFKEAAKQVFVDTIVRQIY